MLRQKRRRDGANRAGEARNPGRADKNPAPHLRERLHQRPGGPGFNGVVREQSARMDEIRQVRSVQVRGEKTHDIAALSARDARRALVRVFAPSIVPSPLLPIWGLFIQFQPQNTWRSVLK